MTDLRRLFEGADAVAVRAAELLLRMQRQDIGLTRKERLDVVTAADLASEKLVVAGLRALTPDAAILSEERERADRRTARWIVVRSTARWTTQPACRDSRSPWPIRRAGAQSSASPAPLVAHYMDGSIAIIDGGPAGVDAHNGAV